MLPPTQLEVRPALRSNRGNRSFFAADKVSASLFSLPGSSVPEQPQLHTVDTVCPQAAYGADTSGG